MGWGLDLESRVALPVGERKVVHGGELGREMITQQRLFSAGGGLVGLRDTNGDTDDNRDDDD